MEAESSAEREALLENLQEGQWSRASSRTSPTTVHSWIWAASTVCCTSPTWPGSASSTRAKSLKSARKITVKVLKFDRERNRVSWV
jgi:hypothetical protein